MKIYLLSKKRREELQMKVREVWKNLMNLILKMDKSHLSKFHPDPPGHHWIPLDHTR
jgi:hypothetical protein